MVRYIKLPKGKRRPPGTKTPRRSDPRKTPENIIKNLTQFYRGLRQKPGGTKPKPKAVPKGTKTGPAVKGEMTKNPRPKKPEYRPKGVRPKVRVLADVKGIRDPKRPVGRKPSKRPTPSKPTRGPIRPSMPLSGTGPRPKPKRPTRRPPTRRPSRRPTGGMDAIRRGKRGQRRGPQK